MACGSRGGGEPTVTQWGLDTLFNPAKRHMDEEKRRLQSTREEIGDSSGGKRIDLESGSVTISKPDSAADTTDTTDTPTGADVDAAEADATKRSDKRADETPAQARARARRQRNTKS